MDTRRIKERYDPIQLAADIEDETILGRADYKPARVRRFRGLPGHTLLLECIDFYKKYVPKFNSTNDFTQ